MEQNSGAAAMQGGRIEGSGLRGHALLFAVALLAFLPAGLYFPDGYDALSHLCWNTGFGEVLRSGTFYPRWLPEVNQGDGGPLFIFYGPLFSYLVAAFSWALGPLQGLKLATFLIWWGAGAAMFLCAREFLGREAGLVTALAYLLFPYHVYDLYRRAGFPELSQFVWLPLILLCLARLNRGGPRPVLALAACIAGSLATHLVTAALILYLLAAAGAILLFRARPVALRLLVATVLGILLAGVYLVPAFWERGFIDPFSLLTRWNFRYHLLFVKPPPTLPPFSSVWMIRLDVGLVLLILTAGLAVSRLQAGPHSFITVATLRRWSLALCALTVFMTLPVSLPLWSLPGISYLMFPLRWHLLGCFGGSFLLGIWYQQWREAAMPWKKSLAVGVVVVLNLLLSAIFPVERLELFHKEGADWRLGAAVLRDVRFRSELTAPPRWIPNIEERLMHAPSLTPADPPVAVESGRGKAEISSWLPSQRDVLLDFETPGAVELRTFYYPAWTCSVDGREVTVEVSSKGRLQVAVPAGQHTLSCRFSKTPDRTLGERISLLTLLAALVVLARNGFRSKE
jgi:hypothetical protein